MKEVIKYMFCIMAFACLYSCSETELKLIEKSSNVPGKVIVTNVESTPGGVIITYTLPEDPDLLYVMARYVEKGVSKEFKASFYVNRIIIEGLSREDDYTIELTAVNRSGKSSEGVPVKVRPLKSPLQVVFESLKGTPTFGGIEISYDNPSKALVRIGVLTTDENGDFYEHDARYSSDPGAKFSLREFETVEREFRVYVKDRWENTSDTVSFKITPVTDKELDKKLFKGLSLPGDANPTAWGGKLNYIWDGSLDGNGAHTGAEATGIPKYISFDLGVNATLSRFKLWGIQGSDKHMFGDFTPRHYEIWGRSEPIAGNDNGEFSPYWFKMGEIESIKPSGLPLGMLSDEDRAAVKRGDEFTFNYNEFTVRYIRIRCLMDWVGTTNMVFTEVSFWATDVN